MRWIIQPQKSDHLIKQLLINRSIDKKDWADFLNPDFNSSLRNPFKLKGVKEATQIILQSQKIGIFTDYDADGIPAGALLAKALDALKIPWCIFIPKRDDGYGLNQEGISALEQAGCDTLVAIDLGITGKQEIQVAKNKGLKTIIIDHHLVQESQLPPADAIINPKQKKCHYSFKDFSAGGLVYKFVQAFHLLGKITINQLKWWIDLAAISTIADIVPLVGENRAIASFGLKVLKKTKNLGLRKLYQVAKINSENISSYSVSFQIAPRINAPGRMVAPQDAFNLLMTKDERVAQSLAKTLDNVNYMRQQELDLALKRSIGIIEKKGLRQNKILMVASKHFKPGIVGLVAGKIMDKYYRPAIVLQLDKGQARGSARSIEEFHIVDAFAKCHKELIRYGGHARAGGLAVDEKKLENFYDSILQLADKNLTEKMLEPKQKIDAIINLKQVNFTLMNQLNQLEPFGFGNSRPVFLAKNLIVQKAWQIGSENQHLKLVLSQGTQTITALMFSQGSKLKNLKNSTNADFVFSLDVNHFNGQKNIEMKVIDYRVN